MELSNILQYQKIDMGVYRQEKEFNQCKERELLKRCKKTFEEKKANLISLGIELDNTLALIKKYSDKLNEIVSGNEWESLDIEAIANEETLLQIDKRFVDFENKIIELEKEFAKAVKKEEDIAVENKRLNDAMEELNNSYKHINALLEKKKAEMIEQIKPALIQLKKIAPELDKDLYAKYTELRRDKKMPAIVIYNNGCCGACGMDIGIEVDKKLISSGDIAECPHCGRIVYKA